LPFGIFLLIRLTIKYPLAARDWGMKNSSSRGHTPGLYDLHLGGILSGLRGETHLLSTADILLPSVRIPHLKPLVKRNFPEFAIYFGVLTAAAAVAIIGV
jgi:hypothetical protein